MNSPVSDARVILLAGEEFQRGERLKEILDEVVDPATRDFNFDVIWCRAKKTDEPDAFSPEKFVDLIMTFPLMAERRVVVLRNFDELHRDTQKKAAAALKDAPETTLIIVEGEKATLDTKPKTGFVSETFKPVYEHKLPQWIRARLREKRKTISEEAINLLMNNLGNNLSDIASEIEKVIIIAGERTSIGEEDVRAVVGEFRRDTVYELCNAAGLGDFGKAVSILDNLMENEKNKETFYIASLFAHILKIAAYNSRVRAGVPHDEAVKAITTSWFWKLNRYDEQAGNLTPEAARNALIAIGRAESLLKKSGMDRRLLMELMMPFAVPARKQTGRS